MPNGYWGKILFVSLSTGEITVETPPEEVYRRYLGGYGLGASLYPPSPPALTETAAKV